ncbi:hypothetical protein PVAP13_2NG378103 [Panicum virgatum]|uniref:Uncharacterized protein n=1 Tax=Panicum virgatum TaxID=38727 RepID=A0A8T0VG73_PANVG|nr:hypothetical protein PVAP13_2NG378103 [Panicum virgatum]
MPHGGGGRRAGRVPVLRFRGAARPRAHGGHPCVPSRGARGWGGPARRLTCGSRGGGCFSRGTNPARDIGPALAPMPPRPRRLLFRSEHSPPRADLDAASDSASAATGAYFRPVWIDRRVARPFLPGFSRPTTFVACLI